MVERKAIPSDAVDDAVLGQTVEALEFSYCGFRFIIINPRNPDVIEDIVRGIHPGEHDLDDIDKVATLTLSDGIIAGRKRKECKSAAGESHRILIGVCDCRPCTEVYDARWW